METKMLMEKLKKIEMTEEMKKRIIKKCYVEEEKNRMSEKENRCTFKRPMIVITTLILCLCLTGVTALAATGKIKGFFKDITRKDGAIIGTLYEQATDEIVLSVLGVDDELKVLVTMIKPKMVPYITFETFGFKSYKILDTSDKVIMEGEMTKMVEVIDGEVSINIALENIPSGKYKLIVDRMVAGAKAEQNLEISGNWECEFIR